MGEIRLLFLGDIVGKPGRDLIRKGLGSLIDHYEVDLVVANAENAAAGRGVTREIGDQLLNWGVDVMTSGNHIWAQREAIDYIGAESRLLRPANFPNGVPGNGSYLARTAQGRPVGVINLMGRVFMQELDNPFQRVLEEIEALRPRTRVILVDFHAEATSEKIAMGWYLDGRVTAVIGTHTHVQTADEQILPGGTAYLTDVGHDGPARQRHRRGESGRHRQVRAWHAREDGNRDRQSASERHPDRCGRGDGQGACQCSASASPLQNLNMSSLFDLPFEEPEPDRADDRGRRRTILTVSDLTANIRNVLENTFSGVWVEAEISNCRLWNTGHLYFTLKDPGAQIKAVMFRSDVRSLKFKPEDGLHVVVRGRLSVYDPKGEYQLVCDRMEPHGLGALQLAFDQLKRRLQAEGLFDAARKRALPALPRKIGIVTSLDGAAIRDIVNVLGRRYPNAHLVIRPDTRAGRRGRAPTSREAFARSSRCAASMSSSWDVAADRSKTCGPSMKKSLRGPSSRRRYRSLRPSATRSTSLSPTLPPTSRAPTPSAAAEIVVARKEDFCAHIERLERSADGKHTRDRSQG